MELAQHRERHRSGYKDYLTLQLHHLHADGPRTDAIKGFVPIPVRDLEHREELIAKLSAELDSLKE